MFNYKERNVRQSQVEKFTRYSIRKVSFGAASVAVATGLFFLGGGSVQAAEQIDNPEHAEVQKSQNLNDKSPEPSKEVTGQDSVPNKASDVQNSTSVKESTTDTQASAVETPNGVTEKVAINTASLEDLVAQAESRLSQLTENKKTKSVIDDAKNLVHKAKELLNDDTKTQEKVDALAKQLSSSISILNSIKSDTTEEDKVNKNQDPRNGQVIPGKGESGFREAASTTNPIIPAKEGPTNNNKLGSGNNPKDGVFESAKKQFGDIDFTNATAKNKTVNKQWSRSTASQGGDTKILGSVTYNWKEKEITAIEANNNNALNGWKIEGGEKVVAVKPEAPTNFPADRPAEFAAKPSKVYDLNGKVRPNENETPAPNHPLGVNAANQNYANGVNHSGMVGTHSLPKGYYLELGKKGTKISKEYSVNGNSRVMLSAITGGAYGNAGTAGTGERLKITVYDEKGNKISSIRDDQGIGTKYESEHISTPTGSGGNGDGWSEYRAIYEIPQDVKKIRVEIEALDDGTAINKSYLTNTNSTVTDGYFVGAVNLAVGSGAELTTDVKSNRVSGKYGEDNLYKAKQEGTLDITVKSVGGVRHYGFAETEVDIPEGVELPDTVKKPSDWVWFGGVPVASKNISWDESTRKLKIKYQTSGNNAGVNPYIGIGSNKGNNDGTRNLSIPFKTADNYKGTATFKVRTFLPNGLSDGQDNQALNTGDVSNANGKYHPVVNGLRNSDNPEYYYNKTIYIDSTKPVTPTIEAVHTDGVKGEGKDTNQPKKLLISVPEDETGVTNEAREKQDLIANDKNNNKHTLTDGEAATKVDRINHAIGGVTSLKVTLPNGTAPITLTKKADGWYNGSEKVNEVDGKLVLPLPENVNLDEASDSTNPDKRIKVTVYDKAGNESDPAYGEVKNEAPTVAVKNPDLYVYKTKEADKWTNEKVLEKAVPSATDLEDDRDGKDTTKPRIAVSDAGNLNTTVVGTYPVKVQSTDSEGKQSTETTVNVHVLDLITVDPTVTTDPTDPSSTSPVSPKTEGTPVKDGDTNRGTYPSGVTREDLVKEVTRTIKYLKEADKDKVDAQPIETDKVDKIQKVTYKRTATVNPETKEVTYSDWTVYEGADKLTDATVDGTKGKFNEVPSPVVNSYLLVDNEDKIVPAKEAPTPTSTGLVAPEVKKVLYKEIGSFVPNYPNGKKPNDAPEKIHYPNHSTDPTKPGDFGTITIPYVPGYTPVYNGVELTPKNPNNPKEGYKVPDGFKPTDNFGNSEITYTPSNQKATVVIEKKVDSGTNEVVQSYELTGKSGEELPTNTDIENKIKELKNKGYEVESDGYHTADNHHPTFDDQEDVNPTDGTSTPSQTFKVVVKPRIIEVPVTTPHEKDTPVDPNGENPDLKWPDGLTETDLKTTAKRVISYVKKESDTATEEKAKDSTEQVVTFTRKAKVNLVDKTVEYTDWEAPNKTWDKVEVETVTGYIADKKEVAAKEVPTPTKDTKIIPDEAEKVTYTKIGSWTPINPTTGLEEAPIPFPNDPNDPTKTGEITQIIPHKDGYTPKDGNGTPLEPVNPANPAQGYKPPKITDPKANIKITYDKDDQKAKVKFVSVDPKTQTETELTDHALTLTGKSGETISESDVQTHIDVLKSMGYDIVDNPFDKDPVFDTKKDTNDNITQEFTIKVQPRVSTAKTVYVVEGDKPSAEKVGGAVTPGKDGKVTNPDVSSISTDGKAGQEIKVPVTVTYGANQFKRDEPVEVTVKVLPKPAPKGVTVLNGTSNEKLIDAIRENVNKAISGLTNVPEGVTPFIIDDAIATPKTDKKGQQTPVTVTVKYRDNATGKVIDDISVNVDVPVNVVGSTPTSKVVFEGDEITAKDITDAVTPGEKGTKGEPTDLAKDITANSGVKEVTVPVTYTDQNGETLTEPVKVKVTVLPKPTPQGIIVAKDSDKEKAKEKALAKAKEAIADGTFKGKLPENVTNVSIDENVDNPDLSDDTDVNVTVKYTVDGKEKTTVVKVPVTVVEGVPQIVPVDENNKQPNPENSIDKTEYPKGSTFEYDPNTPVDTTTPGDYTVNVIVKDKEGNPIAEVPATVRVVESYPQFVPVDKDKKQPSVEGSIDPKAFPKDTEFSYETPVDTTTPGEKDVVVVAKIGDKVIAKVPAKVMVVEPKTQYVPVDKSNKQPDASKSIDPEQYPDGVTFKYKTPVDTATPGEKDVIVEAKDGEDKLVEVPAKVKVVEGKEQLIPVNPTEKPQARDSITPSDYPEGSTFEYKVPEGQTEPFDATTVGDKPVTVVVKDKNGNVLVEVPATIKVVEAKPTPIETPVTNTPLTKEDIAKYVKVPEGSKVTNVENIPDLTTPGQKNPVKVTVTLPNGKTITVDVPVNVTPVNGIETPVTKTPLTSEDYTKGITIPEGGKITGVTNIPDLTTPGQKESVKVTVELPNGKTITVDVPVTVTPVKGIETPVTKTPLSPEDYTKGIKIPEGGKVTGVTNIPDLTTPGQKDPVKVTVELPNGKTITIDVPVTVTPATGIETPVTDTPLTKEDIGKHVKVPEGGKIVEVGKIPEVNTPGDKGTVKVKIELPNGKQIEVEVPVKVTPIKDIVKKLGEPITNEDVEKHIQIPEGGKIISIGDKPSTDVPGERPSIPVVIELPGGKRVTVKVPVIVTPKTTPIVVEVGTPITEDMVKKHVDLPEGWKITKVGEIPKTNTPGDKPSVTVEIELPDGRKVTVDVPVKVTPKSNHGDSQGNNQGNNGSSTTHIVTRYQDGEGKEISPEENGIHGPKTIEGYEYTGTKTDKNGNVIHTYKKVAIPTRSEQPVSPVRPSNPDKPVVNPTQVSRTESNQAVSATTVSNDKKELPNTGTEDKAGLASLGLLGMLGAFGLVARKKKED
ncbi:Rib/alpha-like domain-containing protein [Streptococcus mitis]|uniref:Rib/alpha-like domain-containing protein n=1 Tax=Streptococcus mitis TaxID=28037 RepID=UPI0021B7952E